MRMLGIALLLIAIGILAAMILSNLIAWWNYYRTRNCSWSPDEQDLVAKCVKDVTRREPEW